MFFNFYIAEKFCTYYNLSKYKIIWDFSAQNPVKPFKKLTNTAIPLGIEMRRMHNTASER